MKRRMLGQNWRQQQAEAATLDAAIAACLPPCMPAGRVRQANLEELGFWEMPR